MGTLWEKLKNWEKTATKREKFLIVLISIIAPLFLFYQFYYVNAKEKINTLEEDIKKLDLEIKKYQQRAEKFKFLEIQIKQREEFLERIKGILPSEKEIPDLLRKISDLAKDNALEVITFEPGKEIPKDYYATIPINMEIAGKFNNVLKFFNDVESLQRLIVLNNVKFQVKNNQLNAVITFHTFKYTGVLVQTEETGKGEKSKKVEKETKSKKEEMAI